MAIMYMFVIENVTIINKMVFEWLNLCLTMKWSWNNRKIGFYSDSLEINELRMFFFR